MTMIFYEVVDTSILENVSSSFNINSLQFRMERRAPKNGSKKNLRVGILITFDNPTQMDRFLNNRVFWEYITTGQGKLL